MMSQGWIQLSNALWPFSSFLFPGPHPSFSLCFQDPLSHPHTPHKYTDTYSSDTHFFLWHRIPSKLFSSTKFKQPLCREPPSYAPWSPATCKHSKTQFIYWICFLNHLVTTPVISPPCISYKK